MQKLNLNASKLKAGQLYTDDSGATREWTGKGWSTPTQKINKPDAPVSEEAARSALGSGIEDDDEVDDEED